MSSLSGQKHMQPKLCRRQLPLNTECGHIQGLNCCFWITLRRDMYFLLFLGFLASVLAVPTPDGKMLGEFLKAQREGKIEAPNIERAVFT
jgi:hypothetical protein